MQLQKGTDMTNMTAVEEFIRDIDCLDPIYKWLNKVNIFDVLGITRAEIRHSNMLGWLMDPNQNHGLGDCVLRGILKLVTDDLPRDYRSFIVRREANYIDILAVSNSEKYVLSIENKVDTGEHDNQLMRYKQYVDSTYPGYRQVLIYLTPRGRDSSLPGIWHVMGYEDIQNIIEESLKTAVLQPEAALLINNYIDVIKGLNGGDKRIKDICTAIYRRHRKALDILFEKNTHDPQNPLELTAEQKKENEYYEDIYRKHRKALDLIHKYKPSNGSDPIADAIHSWAAMKADEEAIDYHPEKSSDATTRFKTAAMSLILPDAPGRISGWEMENFYFYEIRNVKLSSGEHELYLQMAVSSKNITDDLRKSCDRINEIYPADQKKENWIYRINYTTKHVFFQEHADEVMIFQQLDEFLEEVNSFEQTLQNSFEIK